MSGGAEPGPVSAPADRGRSRSVQSNFLINVAGAIIPLAVSLVTVPIYIRHIGDARYGVLSVVWVLLGYFGFLDLGLSRAAANALARLRDAPQEARARVLVTTLVLNAGMGLIGSVVLAAIGGYLLQHLLTVPETLKPEISSAFPWIIGLFPLALISGVGIGALEAREQFALANVLQGTGMAAGQIVPVLLAVAVSPSLSVVIPAAALTRGAMIGAILFFVARAEWPLRLTHFDRREIGGLLRFGGWVSASAILSPLMNALGQIVIGILVSMEAVAHYAVPMNLVLRSQIFAVALARTLFPRLSSAKPDDARDLAARAFLAIAFCYAAICAPAMILTPIFFRMWVGASFAAVAAPVAEILFIGAWMNGLAYVPFSLLVGQGRPRITGTIHAFEIIPFVLALWLLTTTFGVKGTALAWTLRSAADAFCLLWAADLPHASVVAMLLPLACLVTAFGAAQWVAGDLVPAIVLAGLYGAGISAMALLVSDDLNRAARRSARGLGRITRALPGLARDAVFGRSA